MKDEFADLTGSIDRRGFLGKGAGALGAAAMLGDGQPWDRWRARRRRNAPGGLADGNQDQDQDDAIGEAAAAQATFITTATQAEAGPHGRRTIRIRPSSSLGNSTRLASLQTDYVNVMFLHALGDRDFDFDCDGPRARSANRSRKRSASRARRSSSVSRAIIRHYTCSSRSARKAGSSK